MQRPSETISATVGTIVGSVITILALYGVNVPDGVAGPAVTLVSFLAAGVTWYVSRKQAAGQLGADSTGKVVTPIS